MPPSSLTNLSIAGAASKIDAFLFVNDIKACNPDAPTPPLQLHHNIAYPSKSTSSNPARLKSDTSIENLPFPHSWDEGRIGSPCHLTTADINWTSLASLIGRKLPEQATKGSLTPIDPGSYQRKGG
uniref:Uncharacterized protein n=1 Tax=Salix viminalis TaxID=40686 RepID=A0A6N2NDI5_SALVM